MVAPVPEKMQAWKCRIGTPEPIRSEVPVPKPGDDDVLVKVLAMGVCHSDCTLLSMKEPITNMRTEYILGHEAAGEIVQLGASVTNSQHAIGDKVAILITPGCGDAACPQCSRGLERVCREKASGNYGLGISDGMFAEYISVKARAAVKIPEGVNITHAAVSADAVLTAYYAVKYTAKPQPGQTIAIYGFGGLGVNAVQTAQHLGVERILVVDKRQHTLDDAIKLGIPKEHTFCTGDPEAKRIEQYVAENGYAVDITLDFVGHAETVQSAQFTVRPGGKVVLVGLISPAWTLIPLITVMNQLNIVGSYNGTADALVECLDLMAKGVLKPSVETGSIEDLPTVLKDLDEGRIKSRMVLLPEWKKE